MHTLAPKIQQNKLWRTLEPLSLLASLTIKVITLSRKTAVQKQNKGYFSCKDRIGFFELSITEVCCIQQNIWIQKNIQPRYGHECCKHAIFTFLRNYSWTLLLAKYELQGPRPIHNQKHIPTMSWLPEHKLITTSNSSAVYSRFADREGTFYSFWSTSRAIFPQLLLSF